MAGNRRAAAGVTSSRSRRVHRGLVPQKIGAVPYRLRYLCPGGATPKRAGDSGRPGAQSPVRARFRALPCSFVEERYESELTRAAAVLDGVDRALERLSEGTYGQCETCGAPILDADLERDPTRRLCEQHLTLADRRSAAAPPTRPGGRARRPSAGDLEPLGGVEAARHVGPVDDVPQRGEEVGLHVLVLQVEGVLPGVEDEERDGAAGRRCPGGRRPARRSAGRRGARRPAHPSPSPGWSRWPA